ncbi:MAG: tetratricopeptide repeat protein [Candidatus Obscuribacterales bacterium]|nr:tetratricopeptide repeat protein [Candidatus Obscuribacterales bacterium]
MKEFRQVVIALTLLVTATYLPGWATENSESFHSKAAVIGGRPESKKVYAEILEKYYEPARKALSADDFNLAAKLGEAAVREWQKVGDSPYRQEQLHGAVLFNVSVYERQKDWEKAKQAYKSLPRLCPDYPDLLRSEYSIGEICLKQKQFREAEKAFRVFRKSIESYDTSFSSSSDAEEMNAITVLQICSAIEPQGRIDDTDEELSKALLSAETSRSPLATRKFRVAYSEFLRRHNRKPDKVQELEKQLQDNHCPRCKSDKGILRVSYGRSIRPEPGTYPGGCCVSTDSPKFYCPRDEVCF